MSHTLTLNDGTECDVVRLIEMTRRRKTRLVPLDALKISRSKATGFCPVTRYRTADVAQPILIKDDHYVYDGNHRCAKLIDSGEQFVRAIDLSPSDLVRARIGR